MVKQLQYPPEVVVPENGLGELVRVATAINVACLDVGGKFFGLEFTEGECQDFFDTHVHQYFEVEPRGAIGIAVKKLTKAVIDSVKKGQLKLTILRVDLDDQICLLNSWVSFSSFEEWCESRSIELGEGWYELYENEQKIASAASAEAEEYRRGLEGQLLHKDVVEIEKEFDGRGMEALFIEISSLRAKIEKADAASFELKKSPHPKEINSLLNIIGVLLELIQTPRSGRQSESAVINEMVSNYSDKFGISQRNLQKYFASAKRILRED